MRFTVCPRPLRVDIAHSVRTRALRSLRERSKRCATRPPLIIAEYVSISLKHTVQVMQYRGLYKFGQAQTLVPITSS